MIVATAPTMTKRSEEPRLWRAARAFVELISVSGRFGPCVTARVVASERGRALAGDASDGGAVGFFSEGARSEGGGLELV